MQKTFPVQIRFPTGFINLLCSYELHHVIAHLIKLTITSGKSHNHWKHALVTPVPKVTKPSQLSELRPISVTSILSRVIERIIVKKYILPSLPQSLHNDQFAYRPTGSTTAALIVLNHHVAKLLETNSYVRRLMVDFSKALDTINHVSYIVQ